MKLWRLAKWQLRVHCPAPLLGACVWLAALPLLFSTENLPAQAAARLLEGYFPLCGVPLLVGLFEPERERGLRDPVAVRRTPYLLLCALRAGWLLLAAGAAAVLWAAALALRGCAVSPAYAFAAFAGTVFLGGLALLGCVMLGSVVAGAMPVLGWVLLDLMGGLAAGLSLQLYSSGQGLPKTGLLALGCLLMGAAFAVRRRQLLQ